MIKLWLLLFAFVHAFHSLESHLVSKAYDESSTDRKTSDWEVYAFYSPEYAGGDDNWPGYDWDKITTICIFDNKDLTNSDLLARARESNVKIVTKGFVNTSCVQDEACRAVWIRDQNEIQAQYNLDGVNVDIEWAAPDNSPLERNLTIFMSELRSALKPGAQLTFDAPWSLHCIDGRCYNFTGILEYIDFYFVMSYDEQSQMNGPPCIANANTPIVPTTEQLQQYLELGIPASKMVLGLPWYGYDYVCLNVTDGLCQIKQVPFHGAPCSDAAGTQHCVKDLLVNHSDLLSESYLSSATGSMYYWYKDELDAVHQVWYDNPTTLGSKYQIAKELNLRGVGFWNINCLYYGDNKDYINFTNEMWAVIPDN